MGVQIQQKLNWLQHNLPEGLIVNSAWLQQKGYSSTLRAKYSAHGWLQQVSRGVYRRPSSAIGQTLRWQYAVVSLQTLLGSSFVVGGRTALELQGFGHYLATTIKEVHLYGVEKPPTWTVKLKADARFIFHNSTKLFPHAASDKKPNVVGQSSGVIRQSWGDREWSLNLSSPERAVLELLDEVPKSETFHQADMLMEGLSNLSPRRLQGLLGECRSVKVKRLFFWFAERHNHLWLKAIDREKIDLGKGKRMLVRGGKLDPNYYITVPATLDASQ